MANVSSAVKARVRVAVALCALLAAIAGVVVLLNLPAEASDAHQPTLATRGDPSAAILEVHTSPLDVPETLPSSDTNIAPDTSVIGVTVGGKHRAYSLSALGGVSEHVVNDMLAGRPVSVTYCTRTGCVRVFTQSNGQRLRLAVGGWYDKAGEKQMVLRDGTGRYFQENGRSMSSGEPLPYQQLDYQLTTWGEWRKAHPDTDVYTGGGIPSY